MSFRSVSFNTCICRWYSCVWVSVSDNTSLTLKLPSKICSRRYSIMFFFFIEIQFWPFMWIIYWADNPHEMSTYFLWKIKKNILKNVVCCNCYWYFKVQYSSAEYSLFNICRECQLLKYQLQKMTFWKFYYYFLWKIKQIKMFLKKVIVWPKLVDNKHILLTLRLLRKKWIKPVRRGTSTREVITPLILPQITWNFHIQFADHRWPFYRKRDGHMTRKSRDSHV